MTDGHRSTPPEDLERLRRYLEAVVADRACPVHSAVAFNAAYFGYELGGDGYGNGPFDLDSFPSLTLGDEGPALPVGALVRIETGSDPLFAEIVYKEGRHPGAEEGADVPAWVSGAPVGVWGPQEGPEPPRPVRRELLVPDLRAFGPALQLGEAKLRRFRARQKWLNKDGHVVVDARYDSVSQAGLDDSTAFLHHLLTHQREALLSPLVPVSVAHLAGGSDQERLEDALIGLLDTVTHALRTSDSLRTWGRYALTRTRIGAGLRHDGPLGGIDLRALAGSLERSAAPATRRRHGLSGSRTVYTAIGPWLRGVDGAEPLLTGVEYAVSVCRANLAVADFVRGDTDNGLRAEADVRITLDDDFESGGIWRSHHPGSEEADGSDPLRPAERGWHDTVQPPAPPRTVAAPLQSAPHEEDEEGRYTDAEPTDTPLEDGDRIGRPNYLRINDSEVCWQLPLRLAHLMEERLPLSRMVREGLTCLGVDRVPVRLEISHDGGEIDASEEVQEVLLDLTDESGMLRNVQWPIDFFPGLCLHIQWPRGGTVFRVHTVALEDPVEIDGQLVAHRYDPGVLTREGAPGCDRDGDSAAALDTRRLVLRAVRRFGRLTPDGHALLDRSALPRGVYHTTPAPHQVTALEQAMDELLVERHLFPATGSRGTDGEPHHPVRDGEPLIALIGYAPNPVVVPRPGSGSGAPSQDRGAEHFVHGFLRRLPPGSEPTGAQRAAYREHCRHVGKADGWELPPGYTFVTAHFRRR
ncbi:hypothetical protein [Streptomyces benahoarensis]|uniref:Uncharacterized protein n=1 Tax=Streptomyces benahoarensis TaxID=2595054 RepID=A0A553ZRX1_9ACTN|nr:hypothetical protein [Streptomyces benahoarensis]TSB32675.1 hypothetical protein FNJ62_01030 [Streptomyces benahoarensis]TSB44231.1 hypothetical protein FNZ23_00325 [Streptomyces benahoarensis]